MCVKVVFCACVRVRNGDSTRQVRPTFGEMRRSERLMKICCNFFVFNKFKILELSIVSLR